MLKCLLLFFDRFECVQQVVEHLVGHMSLEYRDMTGKDFGAGVLPVQVFAGHHGVSHIILNFLLVEKVA